MKDSDDIHVVVSLLNKVSEERLKEVQGGERFNIFTLLDRERDEVKCHSKFIGFLLDPNGNHGKGGVFLNLLVALLKECGAEIGSFEEDNTEVIVERSTAEGRLDIFVHDRTQILAIENKVDAGDQPQQMERYIHYLSGFKSRGLKTCLMYLTKFGGKASSTKQHHEYIAFSYSDNIITWLDQCINAFNEIERNSTFFGVMNQYKDLVRKICGGDTQEMRKIKELLKTQENLESAIAISETLDKVFHQTSEAVKEKFLEEARARLIARGLEIIEEQREGKKYGWYFDLSHLFGDGVRGLLGQENGYFCLTFHYFVNKQFLRACEDKARYIDLNELLKKVFEEELDLRNSYYVDVNYAYGWSKIYDLQKQPFVISKKSSVFSHLVTGRLHIEEIVSSSLDMAMLILHKVEERGRDFREIKSQEDVA